MRIQGAHEFVCKCQITHVCSVHPVRNPHHRVRIIGGCGPGQRAPVPGLREPDRSLGCSFHSASRRGKKQLLQMKSPKRLYNHTRDGEEERPVWYDTRYLKERLGDRYLLRWLHQCGVSWRQSAPHCSSLLGSTCCCYLLRTLWRHLQADEGNTPRRSTIHPN